MSAESLPPIVESIAREHPDVWEAYGWRDENSVLNKQRVHPGFLAPFSPNLRSMFIFPPLAKGG